MMKAYQVDYSDVDYHTFKEIMELFCEQNNAEIIYPQINTIMIKIIKLGA
mgnify:CR=1 FL=1